MIVILRPIRKSAWSGLIKYKNCYEDIGSYFTRSGALYTGLTDDAAIRLGEKLDLDLRKSSEFWSGTNDRAPFFIRTNDKDLYLNTDEPMDELKYLFLKNHKRVKTSLLENKATANFVLINKEEEAKKSSVFNRSKRSAISEFDKLSPGDIRKALRVYGHNAENMTNDMAENRLFEIVEADPAGFMTKWVNNQHKETTFIIEQATAKNIIRRNKRLFTYGTETLGHGIEEVINFLEDPINQDVKIAILKSLDAKEYFDVVMPDETPEAIVEEVKAAARKKRTGTKVKKDDVLIDVNIDE